MDHETLTYLQVHAVSIAAKATEGDLLSRRILNLYFKYRGWNANHDTVKMLQHSVNLYRERIERELNRTDTR